MLAYLPKAFGIEYGNALELVNAVDALGLLLRVHEAAKGGLELLSARSVGHTTQAWAVPVDLASLRVKRGTLATLLLELLGGSPLFPDLGGDGVESLGGGLGGVIFLQVGKDGD